MRCQAIVERKGRFAQSKCSGPLTVIDQEGEDGDSEEYLCLRCGARTPVPDDDEDELLEQPQTESDPVRGTDHFGAAFPGGGLGS